MIARMAITTINSIMVKPPLAPGCACGQAAVGGEGRMAPYHLPAGNLVPLWVMLKAPSGAWGPAISARRSR